jgi:hypothetical protein
MFACLSGDQLHGGIDTTIANESKTHGHSSIMNEANYIWPFVPLLSHGGHAMARPFHLCERVQPVP